MSDASYRIELRKKAIAQIAGAIEHWYEHIGDERGRREIDHALSLIEAHPYIGHPAPNAFEGVRRLHLRELRSHVYYLVDDEKRIVTILALWHTSRGEPPQI